MKRLIDWIVLIPVLGAALLLPARLPAATKECPNIPLPQVEAQTEKICETAYVSLYDAVLHSPRLVAYELTAKHTLGCLPRKANFHSEGPSAKASEYLDSGYDLGHMMSAEDASWRDDVSYDSFSMVNVAPQLGGLNRQQWARLEESVRAWAWSRGDLIVYVGPIFSDKPKHLGKDVAVPSAFFKVLVDKKSGEVLAFEMPQKPINKGDLAPWITALQVIESEAGIKFPGRQASDNALWPLDLSGWRKAHKEACGK
jgi:endonuclease G